MFLHVFQNGTACLYFFLLIYFLNSKFPYKITYHKCIQNHRLISQVWWSLKLLRPPKPLTVYHYSRMPCGLSTSLRHIEVLRSASLYQVEPEGLSRRVWAAFLYIHRVSSGLLFLLCLSGSSPKNILISAFVLFSARKWTGGTRWKRSNDKGRKRPNLRREAGEW